MAINGSGSDLTEKPIAQVRIQLSTRDIEIPLPENTGSILVPTHFRRYALSTLVNTIRRSEKRIPFEFLINGSFLRTSLEEYLNANGISAETLVSVEYVRAILPPKFIGAFEHDDWVSSVDVLSSLQAARERTSKENLASPGHERIVSGSYDGLVRIWNLSSEIIATSPLASYGGHSPVKAVRFIGRNRVASAGGDRCIRVWRQTEDAEGPSSSLKPDMKLYGHKASIDSLASQHQSRRLLSGSADHSIGLWSTSKSDAPKAPENLLPAPTKQGHKRRRVESSTSTPQRGPLALMKSHSAPVSDVSFAPNDPTVGYSVSWDHSLKTWDLTTHDCVDTRLTSHSLLSIAALGPLGLLAAGTSARHITLVDPRASATSISAMTLRGHNNAVVTLAADPNSSHGLVSGSHDGTCRVWDVRNAKSNQDGRVAESTYIIERQSAKGTSRKAAGEGVKVFGLSWDKTVGIVSAGEDKQVQINQVKDEIVQDV